MVEKIKQRTDWGSPTSGNRATETNREDEGREWSKQIKRENFPNIKDVILYIERYCQIFIKINKDSFLNKSFSKFQNLKG